jgi:hypothetical protein
MKIILDTDMDTDCDDAGALAILHVLEQQGHAEILGVICSSPAAAAVPTIRCINAWYDRVNLPVAGLQATDWSTNELSQYLRLRQEFMARGVLYNEIIGSEFEEQDQLQLEAVQLYRALLATEPDLSVTICTIGFLTALARLIRSKPDDFSPLTGQELVATKVKHLVMETTALFPAGKDMFNWKMDLPSAATVLRELSDTPITISPLVYSGVYTGKRFLTNTPEGHPVRRAYQINLSDRAPLHHSADLLAVLFAVNGVEPFFDQHDGYDVHLMDLEIGRHEWRRSTGGFEHSFLSLAVEPEVVANHLEDLLCTDSRQQHST